MFLIILFLSQFLPVKAVYNDVVFTSDTPVYISSLGINLTVLSGTTISSMTVNSDSVDFNLDNNSVLSVKSTDQKNLFNSASYSFQCYPGYSVLNYTSNSTRTIKITPTSDACVVQGSSGGGGGSSYVPPVTSTSTSTSTPTSTTTPIISTQPFSISLPYPNPANRDQLLANLNYLLTQLHILQSLQNQQTPSSCPIFTKTLTYGIIDKEVKTLQNFLKDQGFLNVVNTTNYFGSLTLKAVNNFQTKYASEILTSQGFKRATGIWAQGSIKKANQLMGCK